MMVLVTMGILEINTRAVSGGKMNGRLVEDGNKG